MAKSKQQLIAEGKELGLNLKSTMSVYELEHRIAEKKSELESESKKEKKVEKKVKGEY